MISDMNISVVQLSSTRWRSEGVATGTFSLSEPAIAWAREIRRIRSESKEAF